MVKDNMDIIMQKWMATVTKKRCNTCKSLKNIDQFHRNRTRKDGRVNDCSSCIKIYANKNQRTQITISEKLYHQLLDIRNENVCSWNELVTSLLEMLDSSDYEIIKAINNTTSMAIKRNFSLSGNVTDIVNNTCHRLGISKHVLVANLVNLYLASVYNSTWVTR